MRNRWIVIIQIALSVATIIALTSGCAVVPASPKSAILSKWQAGDLPKECPPGLDPRLFEKFKEAAGSQTYTLEFFKDGQVLYSSKTSIDAGTYRFIGDNHVEITWDVLGKAFWVMFGGTVYEVQISGDKMTLDKEGESVTLRRVD